MHSRRGGHGGRYTLSSVCEAAAKCRPQPPLPLAVGWPPLIEMRCFKSCIRHQKMSSSGSLPRSRTAFRSEACCYTTLLRMTQPDSTLALLA
jgi:hypothetical protein